MATAIKIPDIGTAADQVTLVRWLKQLNEPVRRGEALCEVETDKAVSELESIAAGTLLKTVVEEGAKIEQGTTIAYVGQPGEVIAEGGAAEPRPPAVVARAEGTAPSGRSAAPAVPHL